MSILDKIAENVDYSQIFRKMSIWVKICKYLDFGQNYRIISILIKKKITGNLDLKKELSENSILVNIFGKSRF